MTVTVPFHAFSPHPILLFVSLRAPWGQGLWLWSASSAHCAGMEPQGGLAETVFTEWMNAGMARVDLSPLRRGGSRVRSPLHPGSHPCSFLCPSFQEEPGGTTFLSGSWCQPGSVISDNQKTLSVVTCGTELNTSNSSVSYQVSAGCLWHAQPWARQWDRGGFQREHTQALSFFPFFRGTNRCWYPAKSGVQRSAWRQGLTDKRPDRVCYLPAGSHKIPCACMLSRFSRVQLFATLWSVAHQTPLSMGFSRQEYWSGLPCPPRKISYPVLLLERITGKFINLKDMWHLNYIYVKKLLLLFSY